MIKSIFHFGDISYSEALNLQEKEFKKRVDCRKGNRPLPEDIVFLVEHRPVYTIGRHGNRENLYLSQEQLSTLGIEFHELTRGGDITYHGPGQLTVYPIIDMLRYRLGVKDYINLLEESVIRTIARYGIKGDRIEGKTGVWVGKGSISERKISAIGVACSRHVTMHGLALNVGSDISGFSGINPCGLGKAVTSVSLETGAETSVKEVADKFLEEFISLLQLRIPSQGNS